MRKVLIITLLFLGRLSTVFGDIILSGDARVRPRVDIKNYGEFGNTKQIVDNYYLYRARLNIKAFIGDGWFFNTKLGHNSAAYWIGKFGTGDTPNGSSLSSSGRGSLSFMELYYGLSRKDFGFSMGLLPLNGFNNPALDIHFYPTKVVDIPWLIYNNNAFHGFSGYKKIGPGILNAILSVDNNVTENFELQDGEKVEGKDQYTLMLNYGLKLAGVSFSPQLLMTLSDDSVAAPVTYGANFTGPKLGGFTPGVSFYLTSQQVEGTSKYTGNLIRTRLSGHVGPGSLLFWYDRSKMEWEGADICDYSYIWVHYKYIVFKSDKGEFSITPTFRMNTEVVAGSKDYARSKIELTTEFKFK